MKPLLKLPKYVVLEKKRGETPLMALQAWKVAHPEWKDVPASYAGRLDPMAEGKLLVLLGDECKKQSEYTKLDKEYVIEIVLDLSTDSGDVLGLAEYAGAGTVGDGEEDARMETMPTRAALRRALSDKLGTHVRAYPQFSSKTVNGKPLFLYTLENRLDEIQIPTHEETIYRIQLLGTENYSREEMKQKIDTALQVVPRSDEPSKLLGADFRQDAVRARWAEVFARMPNRKFTVTRVRVTCGSGAYMRTLAERVGASLGTTAFALCIQRRKIGRYISFRRIGTWVRAF